MDAAALIISTISAVLQALQTWHEFRGTSDTTVKTRPITATEVAQQAAVLRSILSQQTLEIMARRMKDCETYFSEMLESKGKYLPQEIDEGSVAVGACMCRELWRMKRANGSIPEGVLQEFWYTLDCPNREN
jgi:hypothetical protein